jgi:hypothetical protein
MEPYVGEGRFQLCPEHPRLGLQLPASDRRLGKGSSWPVRTFEAGALLGRLYVWSATLGQVMEALARIGREYRDGQLAVGRRRKGYLGE